MSHRQQTFNPVNFAFEWTSDGWYKWDRTQAHSDAMKARNAEAKRLKALGNQVMKSSMRDQLMTRGGIGSGHPQIEMFVTVYMVEVITG